MEFFIACAPEVHPIISGAGRFRKARWARRGSGKSGGFRLSISSRPNPGEFIWHLYMRRHESKPFRRQIRMCL